MSFTSAPHPLPALSQHGALALFYLPPTVMPEVVYVAHVGACMGTGAHTGGHNTARPSCSCTHAPHALLHAYCGEVHVSGSGDAQVCQVKLPPLCDS